MFIKVYNLEEDENALTTFDVGTHTLGRGSALQCNDKRVSRNHAILEISEDSVKITSAHINPCFLRTAGSKTITILPQDSSSQLNDGDAFAFLPDTFWFKIKIFKGDLLNSAPVEQESKQSSKRHLDDVGEDSEEKRIRINKLLDDLQGKQELEEDVDDISLDNHSEPSNQQSTVDDNIEQNIKQEPDNDNEDPTCKDDNAATTSEQVIFDDGNIKKEVVEGSNSDEVNNEAGAGTPVVKNENNTTSEQDTTGNGEIKKEEPAEESNSDQVDNEADPASGAGASSNIKPRRERCWYGAECYRKNPLHRQDFTHPGDSDFESDPEDNRPTCSFGAACYRRNKDHRRNYKHPPQQPPKKLKNKRTRKKVDRLNVTEYDDSDLSDMSDEDPFEADDDSEEYVEDSDSADTDWEDSQNVDEDSENMKRLVKEAKRFIKK